MCRDEPELGTRVGDRDEAVAGTIGAYLFDCTSPKVLLETPWFYRRARLGSDDAHAGSGRVRTGD
jgi:hypothetical protein